METLERLSGEKEEPSFGQREIRRFITELISDNEDERKRAFEALSRAGDAAVEPLVESLEHENLMVRRQAAEALGMIGTEACIQRLLKVFTDPRPEMFRRANYALWLIGHQLSRSSRSCGTTIQMFEVER